MHARHPLIIARYSSSRTFTLVLATGGLSEKALRQLSEVLWDAGVPLVVIRAYGFIGYIRLQVKEHTIMESHPESKFVDLRLDYPFPSLVSYMDSQDLDGMTKQQHGHTPYLVVLHKCLHQWKKEHDGAPPSSYAEKKAFKEMIMERRLKNEDGVPEEEENFEEACKAVNIALHGTHIPSKVQKILEDPCCTNLHRGSSDFWVICR